MYWTGLTFAGAGTRIGSMSPGNLALRYAKYVLAIPTPTRAPANCATFVTALSL